MIDKSAKEVLEEIEEARTHIEPVNMVLDGAQAHFIIEAMADGLQTVVLSFVKAREAKEWNDSWGSQADVIESSRELGLTAISAVKTFVESLPDELNTLKVNVAPLDRVQQILLEN